MSAEIDRLASADAERVRALVSNAEWLATFFKSHALDRYDRVAMHLDGLQQTLAQLNRARWVRAFRNCCLASEGVGQGFMALQLTSSQSPSALSTWIAMLRTMAALVADASEADRRLAERPIAVELAHALRRRRYPACRTSRCGWRSVTQSPMRQPTSCRSPSPDLCDVSIGSDGSLGLSSLDVAW